jgi:predicted  nucleic acid-binding Zn-ribbon protein
MPGPALEALLVLQDRDAKRLSLESQLAAVPVDIARVEKTIADEKGAIEAARAESHELESKKKILETEIGSIQDKVGKYKIQQLGVRKNDEYQALGREIETMQGQTSEMEGKELELMYAIDAAKKKFSAAEAAMKANIAGHEARIKTLRERDATLAAQLKEAQAEVAAARTPVPVPMIRLYDRLAPRKMPVVVPIRGGKCGGCHLKISSEAESGARGKGPEGEIPTCDQCGRIVYWES